jgi:cell division protein FtsN
MVKQYRKKKSAYRGVSVQRTLMLVVISFFSGYLIASFVDIGQLSAWLDSLGTKSSQLVSAPQLAHSNPVVKPKLEFYTLLTTNHSAAPVPAPPLPTASTAKTSPSTAATTSHAVSTNATPQATAKLETKSQLQPQLQSQPKPVTLKEIPGRQGYTIQVAALRVKQDAERMKATLLMKGFEVNITSVASNGVIWYRVMVGSFASRAQAERTQSILARRERVSGIIRKMET